MLGPLSLADATETEALGARLALALCERSGWVVFLHGDLGAGKTTLVRAWLRALGVQGTIRSPTYTLIEPYEIDGRSLLHLDLYRLNDPEELLQLGLADTPPQAGGWLVEWPERGGGELPAPDIEIRLEPDGLQRRVSISAGPGWRELIEPVFGFRITSVPEAGP
ncbi:MAG: tRNA ((37)-N6)-threonylcarbamoyltransferase complex ATPase subunit type 1 TsaE [Nevskia sp.]|nr:tRNA ((37)-N6)-threonylcarbamoyltransferase complex ATPase subunit type 1 TsaE [Nevskia sp.]